ncbi:MAG: orotidine-5'-phosphate decarboxylase [Saprospiraceae bacterium]|nr:orotidine-5'-phosphate decarboxylase [Saprospiraceae bacterium]MBK7789942.1 orotidine-5'-phosphate decarboxylase [Saprospiraceae bacterium]MBK8110243.1 orotidine-5'-phosphate decarboxylase [Saprospiraceae bacterium]MBL0081211.1 orotidine-5'-phosphate decarboxylase [Saprospiraceae bacterium]
MNREQLIQQIRQKQSFLCVGLDPDMQKIPAHLKHTQDPVYEFCKEIIEQTHDLTVAYKPNLAFFECLGTKGWETLEKVKACIPSHCFTIADAKRGDIGNTSAMYAKAFFEFFNFDAVTVAPYMGRDSVEPFLAYDNKWVIVLGLTSNQGAQDFEMLDMGGEKLYEKVITTVASWGTPQNTMFVVGATHPHLIKQVRDLVPDYFFLVPGVGAQGGDMQMTCENGLNQDIGLLINSSRNILYASSDENFGRSARQACLAVLEEMKPFI